MIEQNDHEKWPRPIHCTLRLHFLVWWMLVVKKNVKISAISLLYLCISSRSPNFNQYSCKNQLEMDLSRSTKCRDDSPTFLTYILDNLFSFCHKDASGLIAERKAHSA